MIAISPTFQASQFCELETSLIDESRTVSSLSRCWIAIGALIGAIGVGLGAWHAHGLEGFLARHGYAGDELMHRMEIFETAVRYQMLHAVAIVLTGLALAQRDSGAWRFAGWSFLVGLLLFSGLLKIMTFADPSWNWLGRVVPFGGLAMILGWLALAVGALQNR
jgi:uncharacterized membrane protein YgdD (TMEM256/DUF423 family)